MLVSEFPFAEIAGAAERDRTGVTENLPLPLRGLYGVRRTAAVNELSVEQTAVDKIEGQGLEANDFGHLFNPQIRTRLPYPHIRHCLGSECRGEIQAAPVQRRKAPITSSREMIPASC
jgi:hypothetical protein